MIRKPARNQQTNYTADPSEFAGYPGRGRVVQKHVAENLRAEPVTDTFIDEVARITARLHAIPADWAIKYRQRLHDRYPAMSRSKVTDHLWLHVVRFHQMLRNVLPTDLEILA